MFFYIKKRFLDIFPTCLLFWANVLFFCLFYLKKYFVPIALLLIIFSGYTIAQNYQHKLLIVSQPYDFLPLTMSAYRAIFACGIGVLTGIIHFFVKKYFTIDLKHKTDIFISLIEVFCIVSLGIVGAFCDKDILYLFGIVCFSILLLTISLECSFLHTITSFKIFHFGEKYLFASYVFSSIALLCAHQCMIKFSEIKIFGNTILFGSILLSVFWGFIVFHCSAKVKKIFIR